MVGEAQTPGSPSLDTQPCRGWPCRAKSPRALEPSRGLSDPVLLTWALPWPSLFPVTLSSGPSPLRYTSSLTKTLQRTLGETTTFRVTAPSRRRGTEAQTRQAMSLLRATTRPHTQVPGSLQPSAPPPGLPPPRPLSPWLPGPHLHPPTHRNVSLLHCSTRSDPIPGRTIPRTLGPLPPSPCPLPHLRVWSLGRPAARGRQTQGPGVAQGPRELELGGGGEAVPTGPSGGAALGTLTCPVGSPSPLTLSPLVGSPPLLAQGQTQLLGPLIASSSLLVNQPLRNNVTVMSGGGAPTWGRDPTPQLRLGPTVSPTGPWPP